MRDENSDWDLRLKSRPAYKRPASVLKLFLRACWLWVETVFVPDGQNWWLAVCSARPSFSPGRLLALAGQAWQSARRDPLGQIQAVLLCGFGVGVVYAMFQPTALALRFMEMALVLAALLELVLLGVSAVRRQRVWPVYLGVFVGCALLSQSLLPRLLAPPVWTAPAFQLNGSALILATWLGAAAAALKGQFDDWLQGPPASTGA